jgi:tetraacyldisaccharide 4'-kinase
MSDLKEKGIPVLIVAGIASPNPLVNYIKTYCAETDCLLFSDHHDFSQKDCQIIVQHLEKIKPRGGILLTTEKDGMRLLDQPALTPILDSIFVLPLHIHFLFEEKTIFDQKLLDYVRINKRNNPLAKRTHSPTT